MLFALVSPKGFSERELGVQATLLGSHLDRETWGNALALVPGTERFLSVSQKRKRKYLHLRLTNR